MKWVEVKAVCRGDGSMEIGVSGVTRSIQKPEAIRRVVDGCDIYTAYFQSMEEAEEHIRDAQAVWPESRQGTGKHYASTAQALRKCCHAAEKWWEDAGRDAVKEACKALLGSAGRIARETTDAMASGAWWLWDHRDIAIAGVFMVVGAAALTGARMVGA